ncbi:MAG: hypothetical protein WCO58_01190 [bacterium]
MKKIINFAISLFVLLVLFISTGCNQLKEGKVVSKHYEPTRNYIMFMTIPCGKSMVLKPYIVTDNEDWVITIEGLFGGKNRTEDVYVTSKQYNCLQKGDNFFLNADCSAEDLNNTKQEK